MKKFKMFLMTLVVCFSAATATVAAADDASEKEIAAIPVFEAQFNLAVGGAPWMAGYENFYGSSTTAMFTGHIAARFRLPKYTPLVLEVDVVFPHGVGANIAIDIVRTDKVRVHIGNLGVFGNLTAPVSVASLERKMDIIAGLGLEVKLTGAISFTADWRIFLPEPKSTLKYYGDFARPFYDEAFKGGQIWIGFSRVW